MSHGCDTVCDKHLRISGVSGMYTGTPRRLAYSQRGRYTYHKVTSSTSHRSGFAFLVCLVLLFTVVVLAGAGAFGWYLVSTRDDHTNNTYSIIWKKTNSSYHTEVPWTRSPHHTTRYIPSPLKPLTEADLKRQRLSIDNVTEDELTRLAQILWDYDKNRLSTDVFSLNLQAPTNVTSTIDRANNRLFAEMLTDLRAHSDTYLAFIDLLDNYNHEVRIREKSSVEEEAEIDWYLDTVLGTDQMKELEAFLRSKGMISGGPGVMWDIIYRMWFEPYSRSPKYNTTDSCGFEHVFVGETRGSRAMGLHSWIQFYFSELSGAVNYQGYLAYQEPRLISVQFLFHGKRKRQGSFFVGTSPEFDLALYTMCSFTRFQKDCTFKINNVPLRIQTWDVGHKPGMQVATAYPAV